MCFELLNDHDYQEILHRRFARADIKFVSAGIKSLSENIEGFLGEHYKLELTYELNGEQKCEYFFVKTKPTKNQIQGKLVSEMNVYATEIFLYNFLFEEFEKYGFDTSFSPKCYYCVPEETLIMEDVTRKGFCLPERGNCFSLELCKCGLKSLASLHAAGFMYENVKAKELGRKFFLDKEYAEIFKERFFTRFTDKPNISLEKWFRISIEMFCELINYLPETEDYKNEFKKRLAEKEIGKIFVEETNIKKTCTHGDLWSNNVLFKMENGVTYCLLVDYQLARYFYPAYDVLLFLQSNTDTEFRAKHLEELLEYYYLTLSDTLGKHGFAIMDYYPREDYRRSVKIVDFETKMQAYSVRAFVNLPAELLNKHVKDDTDSFNKIIYDNRVEYTVDAFKKDDTYRKIITANLYELHRSLLGA